MGDADRRRDTHQNDETIPLLKESQRDRYHDMGLGETHEILVYEDTAAGKKGFVPSHLKISVGDTVVWKVQRQNCRVRAAIKAGKKIRPSEKDQVQSISMTRNDKWSYTFQDAGRWSFAEISRKLSECEINVTPCTRRNSKKQFNNSSTSSAASSATSSVANQDESVVERKLKYGATDHTNNTTTNNDNNNNNNNNNHIGGRISHTSLQGLQKHLPSSIRSSSLSLAPENKSTKKRKKNLKKIKKKKQGMRKQKKENK